MNAGSLFTGIGGLDLGVDVPPAWFCEYDKHCRTVLERHWPGVPIYPDVRELGADAPRVDVLHGGYPCQPFSVAGKREGADDPRHLWPEFSRLIRVLRPRVVVAENVAGHLRLGFHAVLADLAGLGMDVRWGVVRASDVGAPHQRARLFIVATDPERSGCDGRASEPRRSAIRGVAAQGPGEGAADAQSFPWSVSDGDGSAPSHANRSRRRQDPGSPYGYEATHGWRAAADDHVAGGAGPSGLQAAPDADGGRLEAGSQLDGEATQDPTDGHPCGRHADRRGVAAPADAHDRANDGQRSRPEPREGSETLADADGGRRDAEHERHERLSDASWGAYAPAIRRWERAVGPAPRPTDERGRLMPEFVEWMMGFPVGWTDGIARTHRLRMLGNAVVPQQARLALSLLSQGAL